jgi:hypothetical protein
VNTQEPIFQMIYKTESHIVVNGIFPILHGVILADEQGTTPVIGQNISLPRKPAIRRIFKYPSWKYPGQLE